MLPSRGRPKQFKKIKQTCWHGLCKNTAANVGEDVFFIPFPKPCLQFINEQVAIILGEKFEKHSISDCLKCSKCAKWIRLFRRHDLKNIVDLRNNNHFICSVHFINPNRKVGPTKENPDPLDANLSAQEEARRRKIRKPPLQRLPLVKKQKISYSKLDLADNQLGVLAGPPQNKTDENNISKTIDSYKDLKLDEVIEIGSPKNVDEENNSAIDSPVSNLNLNDVSTLGSPQVMIHNNLRFDLVAFSISFFGSCWFTKFEGDEAQFLKLGENGLPSIFIAIEVIGERYAARVKVRGRDWTKDTEDLKSINDLKKMISSVDEKKICAGVTDKIIYEYFIQQKFSCATVLTTYNAIHSKKCLFFSKKNKCCYCQKLESYVTDIKNKKTTTSPKKKTNNKFLSKEESQRKLKETTENLNKSVAKIKYLEKKIQSLLEQESNCNLSQNKDFRKILSRSAKIIDSDSFQGKFLKAQIETAQRKSISGYKWDPDIINHCIYLKRKSPSAYRCLKEGGMMALPSEKTLNVYSKDISCPGFEETFPDDILPLLENSIS